MRNEYRIALYTTLIGLLSACGSLPATSRIQAADMPELQLIHHDKNVRLYTRPGFDPLRFGSFNLEHVDVTSTATQELDQKEEQNLGAELEAHFHQLSRSKDTGARLNMAIHLQDITPSSPALNTATLVLAFLPLDTGALTVETIYRDESGAVQARRIERLTGSVLNIKASFSKYGQHKLFLSEWAESCAMSVSCLGGSGKEAR